MECIDNFYNSKYPNIHDSLQHHNYRFVNMDINNDIENNIDFSSCDSIIHLAANIHVDKSVINPILTYKTNLMGTLKLLEIVRKYDIDKFIFASTSEVYGTARYKPIDENHPLTSPHPYGASKIAADRLCNSYMETYGVNVSITRCFNIYGPRQKSGILGSFISILINNVLNNNSPIIYGDGLQTRDYLFIDDAINSYMCLLYTNKSGTYNFGTGVETSIIDITKKVIESCNKELNPIFVGGRKSEVLSLIANYKKAKIELGWEPKFTLDDGLKETIKWQKKRK